MCPISVKITKVFHMAPSCAPLWCVVVVLSPSWVPTWSLDVPRETPMNSKGYREARPLEVLFFNLGFLCNYEGTTIATIV